MTSSWFQGLKISVIVCLQFDREHFSEVFVDLKWFESKVGNKYLNEAAGLAAEQEAASRAAEKEVSTRAAPPLALVSSCQT